jgi:asparagine synthetase B (glutamine-hydrolysing)
MNGIAAAVVSNLILRDDGVIRPEDLSAFDSKEAFARLRGHFALHLKDTGGAHLLARDPLGVNKLFFAIGAGGQVDSSSYFLDLVGRGHAPGRIWSVPSGYLMRLLPGQRKLTLEKYSTLSFADDGPAVESDLSLYAGRIRARLDATFRTLASALAQRTVYVTLSGGLDSTTVAALAREHLGRFVGVTFFVRGQSAEAKTGTDVHYARLVAKAMGIPLELVEVSADALPGLVDEVLIGGQDFRDFNVHCGLVNAALAAAIADLPRPPGSGRPVVLTGDTMNELMADYTPVRYGPLEYYSLPDLGAGKLRRFLVSGLDTGDREVGIFARRGIDTIQPYALYPEVYTAIPGAFLEVEGAKQRLARLVMGDLIPSFIYDRPKVRAQVGGSRKVGGTLAALIDRGIDGPALERRFCEIYGFDPAGLKRWMRAGVYRFTTSYPELD